MLNSILANKCPVINSEDYIGDENLVLDIYDIINAKRNNFAIINDDGVGKSSLLNYINFPDTKEKYLAEFNKKKTLIVKTDKTDPKSAVEFLETLRRCLKYEIKYNQYIIEDIKRECDEIFREYKDYSEENKIRDCLYDIFRFLYIKKIGTIFLIDDFDKMIKNIKEHQKMEMAQENYSFLRDVANDTSSFNVHFIVTSRIEIQKISYTVDVSGLPGIFTPKQIDLFGDREINIYIDKAFEKSGVVVLEDERKMLKKVSGGFPGLLRIACETLYQAKKEGKTISEEQMINDVIDESDLLETHWDCSTLEEKKLYKNIGLSEDIYVLSKHEEAEALRASIKRKILKEDKIFVSKAFQFYVNKKSIIEDEVNVTNDINTDTDYKELLEKHKKVTDAAIRVIERQEELNLMMFKKLESHINSDSTIHSYQDRALSKEEKEEYNEYVVKMAGDYFQDISLNIDHIDTLKNMSIKNIWNKLDNFNLTKIVQGEKLNSIYSKTKFDQSPVGISYTDVFENIIKTKAFPSMKKYISNKYPELKIRPNERANELLLKFHPDPMVGNFKHILMNYEKIIKEYYSTEVAGDKILRIYNEDFKTKLHNIHILRNRISHEKRTEADKVTVNDIRRLRENMFGGEVSCIEYLIRLSEIK